MRVNHLNVVVADMGKLLRRAIGEHIELLAELAPDLVVPGRGRVSELLAGL